jgi:DNA-binding beta-propeller fold protein YncE
MQKPLLLVLLAGTVLFAGCGQPSNDAAPAAVTDSGAPAAPAPPVAAALPRAATDCPADGPLEYLCGLANAEDLLRLGQTHWLIASGMDGQISGSRETGHLYLIDHTTRTAQEWYPASAPRFAFDAERYPNCPGPLQVTRFSAHGLALRESAPEQFDLYITSHGAREAIEIFTIDAAGARPELTWRGCVPLPEGISANSVAILGDGGFVTTKFTDTSPGAYALVQRGEISGEVYEWHPGGTVAAVPGTALSGPNGIALSPDDRQLFVAAFGSKEILRFERGAPAAAPVRVRVDISPDNLHWTPEGKLLTAGGNVLSGCAEPPCAPGWSVYEIDPQPMTARRITGVGQGTRLPGASAALQVGDEIWIGTYAGDRVGILPAKEVR